MKIVPPRAHPNKSLFPHPFNVKLILTWHHAFVNLFGGCVLTKNHPFFYYYCTKKPFNCQLFCILCLYFFMFMLVSSALFWERFYQYITWLYFLLLILCFIAFFYYYNYNYFKVKCGFSCCIIQNNPKAFLYFNTILKFPLNTLYNKN